MRAGQARMIEKEKVETEMREIEGHKTLKSNDVHILALAKASNTKILCSQDLKLHQDFTAVIARGKIYQRREHVNLLTQDVCP